MYAELVGRPTNADVDLLARMVAAPQLRTPIEAEGSWENVGDIARRLLGREFTGTAVLYLGTHTRQ